MRDKQSENLALFSVGLGALITLWLDEFWLGFPFALLGASWLALIDYRRRQQQRYHEAVRDAYRARRAAEAHEAVALNGDGVEREAA